MLAADEYRTIREDYDSKSRKFFPKSYRPPEALTFAESPALFPSPELRAELEREYDEQCSVLFSGTYPTFTDVLARFEELRNLL